MESSTWNKEVQDRLEGQIAIQVGVRSVPNDSKGRLLVILDAAGSRSPFQWRRSEAKQEYDGFLQILRIKHGLFFEVKYILQPDLYLEEPRTTAEAMQRL